MTPSGPVFSFQTSPDPAACTVDWAALAEMRPHYFTTAHFRQDPPPAGARIDAAELTHDLEAAAADQAAFAKAKVHLERAIGWDVELNDGEFAVPDAYRLEAEHALREFVATLPPLGPSTDYDALIRQFDGILAPRFDAVGDCRAAATRCLVSKLAHADGTVTADAFDGLPPAGQDSFRRQLRLRDFRNPPATASGRYLLAVLGYHTTYGANGSTDTFPIVSYVIVDVSQTVRLDLGDGPVDMVQTANGWEWSSAGTSDHDEWSSKYGLTPHGFSYEEKYHELSTPRAGSSFGWMTVPQMNAFRSRFQIDSHPRDFGQGTWLDDFVDHAGDRERSANTAVGDPDPSMDDSYRFFAAPP